MATIDERQVERTEHYWGYRDNDSGEVLAIPEEDLAKITETLCTQYALEYGAVEPEVEVLIPGGIRYLISGDDALALILLDAQDVLPLL